MTHRVKKGHFYKALRKAFLNVLLEKLLPGLLQVPTPGIFLQFMGRLFSIPSDTEQGNAVPKI